MLTGQCLPVSLGAGAGAGPRTKVTGGDRPAKAWPPRRPPPAPQKHGGRAPRAGRAVVAPGGEPAVGAHAPGAPRRHGRRLPGCAAAGAGRCWACSLSAPHRHGGCLRGGDCNSRLSVVAGRRALLPRSSGRGAGTGGCGVPGAGGGRRGGSWRRKMAEGERQAPPDSSEETPPATQSFIIPKKEIHTVPDMGKWKRSQAYADYIGFILTLNEGVKGKKLTFEYKVSEAIEKLVALLNTLDRWIDETPPMDQPSRFGNKAFRTWYARLDQEAENLVATVVPTHLAAAVPEVAVYLKESVGNSTRIDYGTGHEAAFAAFLCCLCKIGVLRVDDQIAIVFKVFNRYLEVMRKLQKTYRMEPAGSQGVWGLDDFQFLPFIWGSSQLIDHPYLEPRHFVDEKAVNENHKDYMFLECILFITEMKTGPFAEHSNQLWNISAVPTWSKVNQGLIRMYKAECLEKFPVIQHFKFGSLLPIHPVSLC